MLISKRPSVFRASFHERINVASRKNDGVMTKKNLTVRSKRREPRTLLAERLRGIIPLSGEEAAAIADLPVATVRVPKGSDLVVPGEEGTRPFLVLDGWLLEHRGTTDGARQVLDMFIPGDIGNWRSIVLPTSDVFISAATEARVAYFSPGDFHDLVRNQARITTALLWMVAIRRSRFFEHMLSLGRRKAKARIGHFVVEIFLRARSAGLATDRGFSCPLRQADIADFVGLTPEHVSRVMARLRADGLIETSNQNFIVRDIRALMKACGIDPAYLHLDESPLGSGSGND